MKKINIEIELGEYGLQLDTIRWSQLEFLQTEGTNLEELLDNAVVFASDQDGGEAGSYEIGETDCYELLEDLVRAKYLETFNKTLEVVSG